MNGFDLSALSPEELQQLTIHCIQANEELTEAVEKLHEVQGMMLEKMSMMDEEVDKVSKVVMEEILGGVEELYNKNKHDMDLDDLKSKYGEMFEPHVGALKEMYPDVDLYEELLKEKEGFGDDEEGFGTKVSEIGSALKAKLDKIRGITPEVAAEAKAEGESPIVEAEEKKVEAVPEANGVVETIKKMKSRKNPTSLS